MDSVEETGKALSVAPKVSKWREKETLGYVHKIEKLMGDPKESGLAAFVKKYW